MLTRHITIVATDEAGTILTPIAEMAFNDDEEVKAYLAEFAEEFEEAYSEMPVSYAYSINTIH